RTKGSRLRILTATVRSILSPASGGVQKKVMGWISTGGKIQETARGRGRALLSVVPCLMQTGSLWPISTAMVNPMSSFPKNDIPDPIPTPVFSGLNSLKTRLRGAGPATQLLPNTHSITLTWRIWTAMVYQTLLPPSIKVLVFLSRYGGMTEKETF